MRINATHAHHVGNMIAISLSKSGIVTLTRGIEPVAEVASEIILADIKKEHALEEKVKTILSENEDEIEFQRVDEKQLFWMIKKKLSKEFDVTLSHEDRYSNIAHAILDELYEEDFLNYDVSENRVKNVIYDAIDNYLKGFIAIENAVLDKIQGYKRELVPGSEEYEIVFGKLYAEELQKRGMA
ncbi:MAG: hypothetical protein KU37_03255 [Sulfuricurvum sp. PC08-66]|nr:MAG: hypothetical protein KU37_03255 [Sulfuricurvum sp. PC08-66]